MFIGRHGSTAQPSCASERSFLITAHRASTGDVGQIGLGRPCGITPIVLVAVVRNEVFRCRHRRATGFESALR
jgi:hypothetical protein